MRALVVLVAAIGVPALAADGAVAWWSFDGAAAPSVQTAEGKTNAASPTVLDRVSGTRDLLHGYAKTVVGVAGEALLFDGFTTRIIRPAAGIPPLPQGWTLEAWIAPQEYSWARTGLVDWEQDGTAGFALSINYLGQIGLHAAVNGEWQGCESPDPVPLLQWTHVAGTFDPDTGLTVYVNGRQVAARPAKGKLKPAEGLDLYLGMAHRKQYPALTERAASKKFLSNMIFDGLMDEVKIFGRALSAAEIKSAFAAPRLTTPQPLQYRVLPSGPKGPRPFGAYYTRLVYCPEWDRIWRVGDFADVLVSFDELPVRLIFWRGTGYCPAWVTENGRWVSDQGPESWNAMGCCEHMSDKRCLFSHVRILENTDARTVVHWRVASPDITYNFNHVDPDTGWGEWTDEYYSIYPDAVAVRYQEVRSTWAAKSEWQQSELLNAPGTRPQDNVELEAMTILNMEGESESWSWETPYGKRVPGSQPIQGGIIQVMNLKSKQRHFVIGEPGARWQPFGFGAREGFTTMPCWNHWPVAQLPNDGRVTPAFDRPSSTCLGTLWPVKHKTDRPDVMIGHNLYGMTGKPAKELAVLARSWNSPAPLHGSGAGFESLGYDKNQRAYVLKCWSADRPGKWELTLAGSEPSPVLNPAFVIKGWGDGNPKLTLQGAEMPRGRDFRYGHRRTLEGTDLILWIKTESHVPLNLTLSAE